MQPGQPSRTAEYMALFRALETVRPENRRLFSDPFARGFLRPSLRAAVRLAAFPALAPVLDWWVDRRRPGARTSAIARTRLIDDLLDEAVAQGAGQAVILGAGFDCRALRLACLGETRLFEVDHPATRAAKAAHLLGLEYPANARFVEIDFNRQPLFEALAEAGLDAGQPTVFVWEGVTNYLSLEAVEAVLGGVGTFCPGTRIIFTYVDQGVLDGSVPFEDAAEVVRHVARLGEPWTFGLVPRQVEEFLRRWGLRLDSDLSAAEYRRRYFGPAAGGMKGYEFYHVAQAHVAKQELGVGGQ